MDASVVVRALDESLTQAMIERGFGPGGPSLSPDGTKTFLFCTGASELASRWPATVRAVRRHVAWEDHPASCLDLTISVSATGKIERADLESADLHQLLDNVGRPDLAGQLTLDALTGIPAADVGARLRHAVEVLMPLGA